MMRRNLAIVFCLFLAFSFLTPPVSAENLVYAGGRRQGELSNNPQDAQLNPAVTPAIPVNYGNQGNLNQYSSFSNLGQSPSSSGRLSAQYMSSPYPSSHPSNMARASNAHAVTEVSPFPQYSPYLEVVGEGSDYKLGIDDIVTIMVRNQPDFSGRFVIDPEGNIQYNYVGNVKADGKTKEELKADLVEQLKKFVRFPEVAVMISEYRSKFVYVFGYVNQPGKYAMKGNKITLREAIVAAGLLRMDASMKNVFVIRPSEFTKDGKPWKKKVDLKKLMVKGDSAENFVLQPGDGVVVNQKHFDRFLEAYTKIVGPVFQTAAVYELGFGQDGNGFLRND